MKKLVPAIMTISLMTSQMAFGFFWSQPKVEQDPAAVVLNGQETTENNQAQVQALQQLSEQMTTRLLEIQSLIDSKKTTSALSLAKATLDEVRIKTGIDPKANLRENILVPVIFPENVVSISQIPSDQRYTVIQTIKNYRGGLYLDIVNLSKRTSLLYIKAFHAEIKKNGGLLTEDRNKIIKDLAIASALQIPIIDKNNKKIIAFDDEVTNEDHIYMFNREIKLYLLNAKDLAIDEVQFTNYVNEVKVHSQNQQTSRVSNTKRDSLINQAEICMAHAKTIAFSDDRNYAIIDCYNKYIEKNRNSGLF